jgi:hypothetical protein
MGKMAQLVHFMLNLGAGGANVVQLNSYLAKAAPEYFSPNLPYIKSLGDIAGPGGSVGWRDGVRIKDAQGVPIEDIGIESHKIVRKRLSDLLGLTNTQYDRIAADLYKTGLSNMKAFNEFVAEPQLMGNTDLDTGVKLDVEIKGIRRLEVYNLKKELVAEFYIDRSEFLKTANKTFGFKPKNSLME